MGMLNIVLLPVQGSAEQGSYRQATKHTGWSIQSIVMSPVSNVVYMMRNLKVNSHFRYIFH